MKVIVIGAIFVDKDYFAEQISTLNWRDELEMVVLDWGVKDVAEFQAYQRKMEESGPEDVMYPLELEENIEEVVAIFTHMCPLPKALLNQAKQLKLIGTCRGGTEHISPYAVEKGIPIINTIRNAEPVADFTLGLIISEYRNIAKAHHLIKNGKWEKNYPNSAYSGNLCDLTVGLLGFGNIGQLVAEKLVALNMRVLVYDKYLSDERIKEINSAVIPTSLMSLYQTVDVLSIHLRFEKGEPPIIDEKVLALLKENCLLINTSRAYAVDEEALYDVLKNKKIAGAALDVFHEEPIPSTHPFLSLDNVTLTPHIAGDTIQAIPKSPSLLVKAILKVNDSASLEVFN